MILYLLKYYLESKLFSFMPEKWVKKMQLKRIRKIFEWSKENSEFYKKIYSDAGVLDLQIKTEEDIKKIPFVDKEMMKIYDIESILTCPKSEELVVTSTSGSTGVPIDIYSTKKEHFAGYVRTFLATKSYNPFKLYGFIGIYRHKEEIEKRSFLDYCQKYFGLFRRESFSVFTAPEEIIKKLKEQKINILSATPSCMKVLIAKLKETGDKLSIKVVILSGETLFDDLKEDIKTYFHAKVINIYGCMEHPTLSWTDPDGASFNYPSNSIFVEYVNPIRIDGDLYGELVITNFANKTMPFVRYKIGDHVKILDSNKKMGKIIGRIDDLIELENGAKIFMVQLYPFDPLEEYSKYKILQKKDKSIYFQAVCCPGVDKRRLEKKIIHIWEENFGKQSIKVEFLNEIPVSLKTGKFKLLERES